jgi:dTDP-3-amino-3,4,6-trideoxy-alpha-D-glucose transaminase
VHLFGHPLDPARLAALAEGRDVMVIEDCAQSVGAARDGKPTGVTGRLAATSLYPTKNLGAMGDGGVLLTDDAALAARARSLRDYGQDRRYHHVEIGLNSRLDELHAAVLRSALLPRLDRWLGRRAEIAERYAASLAGSVVQPVRQTGGTSANHLFPVLVADGDPRDVEQRLVAAGVAVGRHYPVLCNEQPAVSGRGVVIGNLANARRLAERELSLPIHPFLTDAEADRVIEACRAV